MVTKKEKKQQRQKTTTRIDIELLTQANMVALHRGMLLQDYLDKILRPVVEKDYKQMGEQIVAKDC